MKAQVPSTGKDVLDSQFKSGNIITDSIQVAYRIYDSGSKTKRPLIVFLHGAGERGNDNKKQLTWGVESILNFAKKHGEDPIILVPQCPEGQRWVEVNWDEVMHKRPELISKPLQVVMNLVDDLIESNSVDTNRIYATGISMGGFGVWDWISREPHFFTAAIPICGGVDTEYVPELVNLPLWVFHGALDQVVVPERSRKPVEILQKLNASVLYTEYADLAHNVWSKTYADEKVLSWLFSQKKQTDTKK